MIPRRVSLGLVALGFLLTLTFHHAIAWLDMVL